MHSKLGPSPRKRNSWEKSWHPGRCRTCVRIHSYTSALVLTSDIAPPPKLLTVTANRHHLGDEPALRRKDLLECHRDSEPLGTVNLGELLMRSEEHTSELQSRLHLVCRLLL